MIEKRFLNKIKEMSNLLKSINSYSQIPTLTSLDSSLTTLRTKASNISSNESLIIINKLLSSVKYQYNIMLFDKSIITLPSLDLNKFKNFNKKLSELYDIYDNELVAYHKAYLK